MTPRVLEEGLNLGRQTTEGQMPHAFGQLLGGNRIFVTGTIVLIWDLSSPLDRGDRLLVTFQASDVLGPHPQLRTTKVVMEQTRLNQRHVATISDRVPPVLSDQVPDA